MRSSTNKSANSLFVVSVAFFSGIKGVELKELKGPVTTENRLVLQIVRICLCHRPLLLPLKLSTTGLNNLEHGSTSDEKITSKIAF